MTLLYVALFAAFASTTFACDAFPNGTKDNFVWWANDGPIKYYNATPQDQSGAYEYPVHLSKPLVVWALLDSAKQYKNLREDVKIWSWNNCAWSEVPTLGLLSNLDACTNGLKCPINAGNQQWIPVTFDFSKFSAIINLLKDDAPYQLEYKLTDKDSSDISILTAQAHAYTKN